jgi:hypothetical protein
VFSHRVRRKLFEPLADQPRERGRELYGRRSWCVLVLALSSCIVALIPLAHASPVDPLWIAGIYDAADSDEVVVLAASLESLVEETPLVVTPVSMVADGIVSQNAAMAASPTLDASRPRAPPIR